MTAHANTAGSSATSTGGAFLAHHFESHQQQFDAGKLGMWLFLVTEVLFFSGLFVAYAVYRSNHPDVFAYAHQYLNKTLGALNTIVLLFSSLTMAWAVRSAQLNRVRALTWCLATTLACAGFFLGVKAVEYSVKWNEGLLWARHFAPALDESVHVLSWPLLVLSVPAAVTLLLGSLTLLIRRGRARTESVLVVAIVASSAAFFAGTATAVAVTQLQAHPSHTAGEPRSEDGAKPASVPTEATGEPPRLAGTFFSIYYAMTGVHAIHILAGMGVIGWLLRRAVRGEFSATYFGPVDFVGLYWHLVDLVWIYLFPLLYLIH